MTIWVKYLVPINAAIALVWLVHTWWEGVAMKRDFMAAEANAILHLAKGLAAVQQERRGPGYGAFERASREFEELDIMLVDRHSMVVASNVRGRVGRRWSERGIDDVLRGTTAAVVSVEGHIHDGAEVVDASALVMTPEGRFVVHVAKPLRALEASLLAQRHRHFAFALALLVAVSVTVNLLTYGVVIRRLRGTHERLRGSAWVRDHPGPRGEDEVQRLDRVVLGLLEEVRVQHASLHAALGEKEELLVEVTKLRDGLADEVDRVRRELSAAQGSLLRAERVGALASLSAGLAHELRNPLHIVRGTAETVARQHPETRSLVGDIVEEVDRIEQLIKELLDQTRPLTLHTELIDARALLEKVKRRGCRRPGCTASCAIVVSDDGSEVRGDPVLLEQALLNLLTNACDAGAPIELCATRCAGGTELSVADHGPGIPPEDRERVFEPFFTRKAKGTGLGLGVVQRVAELHHGRVRLDSRAEGGTVATLFLPDEPHEQDPGSR